MRIALIAPPFISVPPKTYGGTELFIAQLAEGLQSRGIDVVVYTNGESRVNVCVKYMYPQSQWPLRGEVYDNLKDINHTTWAVRDAARDCDIIHLNNAPGIASSRFVDSPYVYTMHHPHHEGLSEFYSYFPQVEFVTISDFQKNCEKLPRIRTIHHGIDLSVYQVRRKKQDYLSFIGRIAPVKGPHLAIAAAHTAGIPLKIAGEVQPIFREYFNREIKPHLDGKWVEYVGEADLAAKNELLGNSRAMLFPIQWNEPFGLVMIEAMACGTPVLALPGGSVPEIVRDGVSGYVCHSVDELAKRACDLGAVTAQGCRDYVETYFSVERMVGEYADLYSELMASGPVGEVISAIGDDDELSNKSRAVA
jgi:glycosyltransferase involved in cell wall biosynthesis